MAMMRGTKRLEKKKQEIGEKKEEGAEKKEEGGEKKEKEKAIEGTVFNILRRVPVAGDVGQAQC